MAFRLFPAVVASVALLCAHDAAARIVIQNQRVINNYNGSNSGKIPHYPTTPEEKAEAARDYQKAEDDLLKQYAPPAEPALTRKDLEQVLDEKLSEVAKKAPEEPNKDEDQENSNFGRVGGIGGVGRKAGHEQDSGGLGGVGQNTFRVDENGDIVSLEDEY